MKYFTDATNFKDLIIFRNFICIWSRDTYSKGGLITINVLLYPDSESIQNV